MKNTANFFNWVLSKRYDIYLKGEELLLGGGSRLYIPNHQAEIEPVILMSVIGKRHMAAPMISAMYYNIPIIKQFLSKLGAVAVSDLDKGVRDVSVMDNIKDAAIGAFKDGKSVLLYPSGHLCVVGYEVIGNKQSTYVLVQNAPENTKVIGVRINGLWGSIWSKAWIGVSPPFVTTLIWSFVLWLANLIFFIPKRRVEIEFCDITEEAKQKANTLIRRDFNAYLEEFYNVRGEEEVRFIRHHFLMAKLKRKLPKKIKGVISDNTDEISFNKI